MHIVGDFAADGCAVLPALVSQLLVESLRSELPFPVDGAGSRDFDISADSDLAALLAPNGSMTSVASRLLGATVRPARVLLFDKTSAANWSVPWHQDRTIAVAERHDIPGFGLWSRKSGVAHVEPPQEFLREMVALRLHLDDCDSDNGPLEVLPGSFNQGRIPASLIANAVADHVPRVLTARAGDVVAMRGLTLHASKRSARAGHRRVLHVDFASKPLPQPLRWALAI